MRSPICACFASNSALSRGTSRSDIYLARVTTPQTLPQDTLPNPLQRTLSLLDHPASPTSQTWRWWTPSATTPRSSAPSPGLSSQQRQLQMSLWALSYDQSSKEHRLPATTLPWQAFGPSASLSTQKRAYSSTRTVSLSPHPYAAESYRISTRPMKGPPRWNSEPAPSSTGRGYQRTSAKLGRDAQTAIETHPHRLPPPLSHLHHHYPHLKPSSQTSLTTEAAITWS